MKTLRSHTPVIILLIVTLAVLSGIAAGQEPSRPPDLKDDLSSSPEQTREDMLAELGLSNDQFRQLRQMNAERKPFVEAANKRLREANRNLDQVIYGDAVDDGNFRMRLREFQQAQAEVVRIRFENELELRRVLTPDQLVKFRAVRQRYAEARKLRNKQIRQENRPLRRFRQLNRQPGRKLP